MIRENLQEIHCRIEAACRRAGRDSRDVTLIAVSKFHPAEQVVEALRAGQRHFGENRVQEMLAKQTEVEEIRMGRAADVSGELLTEGAADETATPVWHFIGNLQKNKVRSLVGHTVLIHSVSSAELAREIERQAVLRGIAEVPVLIEVNIANESTKQGIDEDGARALVREAMTLEHLSVRGLMAIAPPVDDPEENRGYFRRLRELKNKLREELRGEAGRDPDRAEKLLRKAEAFTELSMGMSGDFEVAVEEGATYVRIGTAIFGAR